MLTEAFDEADDTGPAPLSWHLHGVNSKTQRYQDANGEKTQKKTKTVEARRNITRAEVAGEFARWKKCLQ